jgi:two-component system phosphate regulon sensor histidine kinase PhoR
MELMVPFAEDGQLLRMLSTVRRNGEHLKHLVEEMLKESAHIDTDTVIKVERRCFDLWPVVQDVMHDLEPVAETAATRLVNSIRADLQVYADASLLKRALQNLVANAIAYAPHGAVEVGDGAGIPDGQHGKIFEKGATDHKRDGAIGLGLAIVKAVIEAHGGTVTVQSTPGRGATFRCTLPGMKSAEPQEPSNSH